MKPLDNMSKLNTQGGKEMKKLIALLLALTMVFALAACSNTNTDETQAPTDGTSSATEPATYTYNSAASEFPTNWNPHTYQTATDADILDYIVASFYTFDYNDTLDGYQMVPDMATGEPVDVTADYVGQYGIEEGDTARAYVITIRDDIYWENGDHITVNDIVESAKRLLDPAAQNYRADSMYSGSVKIHGAENYLKQGTYAYSSLLSENLGDDEYVTAEDMTTNENGQFVVEAGDVWFNVDDGNLWSSNSLNDYYGAGYFTEEGNAAWENIILANANDSGYVPVTQEVLDTLSDIIATLHGAENTEAYAASAGDYAYKEWCEFCFVGKDMPEYSWDNVGWVALSDTELLFVMDLPLDGFYLKYNLPMPLVHIPTYDANASVVDGVYTNTYGTSVDTTMSFGPYKLTSFQADKQYVLERNDNFYGLTEDTYQTTKMVVDCVPEAATRLELFLQGKLDIFGLTSDYMDTYQLSDYTYYATGSSTFAMVFNPDYNALVSQQEAAGDNINKTILTIPEFRMAMSYGLDRSAFCLATSPVNNAAFAVHSNLIVSDPESGTAYRTTDPAKKVVADFWGVSEEYGEGKMYADIDEAIASITGYNLTKAQDMFNAAYDIAIEKGYMDEDDVVEIKIGTPNNTSSFYNNGYDFLVNNYTEAVKGTKLEGKLQFTRDDTLGNAFSDYLKNNLVDMLFGVGWTGSALDPYGLMEAYLAPNYVYDPCVDYSTVDVTIAIDGVDYTTDAMSWLDIMNGTPATITAADGTTMEYSCGAADNDPDNRVNILAALEGAVLMQYDFIPIMDESTAQLRGQQINYYTEEYVFGMGFGGVKYYTYNYTDAEWDAYVSSQNGELDYT